ncbi:MAG: aldo/keto reductase [Hoeflea sp.]|uniref:aldo/keto reductase n=1 Tax=Hoeflea sp. TaxID=1940281 RepID=UPI001E0A3111|nr:aldo/keto reductase [Hoeflea sp.]MBU4528119.1 aldo/keto reductase [Alphaproteobacteria bacterium]MBU4543715.1 aldo/keto reductase [Alphaproteobacteria bacterium]MBU4548582.1 aldo/keto reductase [Alphaproteobacteria bacterium]MBV1725748.1 aldo/keto reductase [Hoeflea sp.]MBV1762104.1 aldo/keto reductase [Hoeflea sp.]
MQTYDLAPGHRISRVIKGGWQLAGGHGEINRETVIEDMIAFADAGITTFDCADIYTGVEALIGAFRAEYARVRGAEALDRIKVHTKFVPDLGKLATLSKADVAAAIETSLSRLGMEQLNLVQFHWWDYEIDRQVEVATWLADLRREGKIANIGGTNFDTAQMSRILDAGVPLVSMQVQYSLIDDRPSRSMVEAAMAAGISLLCYGSVGGGLFSERSLGAPEPQAPFENRSLIKYKLIVDEFGGWSLFQDLLEVLADIAAHHDSDIASIASRAVLERPGVAAVIVGARNRDHLERNLAIPDIALTEQDFARINAVLARANPVPGDVYTLERDRNGKHGSVMKYNLNKEGH